MDSTQILTRRPGATVDFSASAKPGTPSAQLRHLAGLLQASAIGPDEIQGCDEALAWYREFLYRKIFTGTSHDEFVNLNKTAPEAIDWLIAVHGVDAENYRRRKP